MIMTEEERVRLPYEGPLGNADASMKSQMFSNTDMFMVLRDAGYSCGVQNKALS